MELGGGTGDAATSGGVAAFDASEAFADVATLGENVEGAKGPTGGGEALVLTNDVSGGPGGGHIARSSGFSALSAFVRGVSAAGRGGVAITGGLAIGDGATGAVVIGGGCTGTVGGAETSFGGAEVAGGDGGAAGWLELASNASSSAAIGSDESSGGVTITMLPHFGQATIWPINDLSRILSRALQVVQET